MILLTNGALGVEVCASASCQLEPLVRGPVTAGRSERGLPGGGITLPLRPSPGEKAERETMVPVNSHSYLRFNQVPWWHWVGEPEKFAEVLAVRSPQNKGRWFPSSPPKASVVLRGCSQGWGHIGE